MIDTVVIKERGFVIKQKPNLQDWKCGEQIFSFGLTSGWEWTAEKSEKELI